MLYEAPESARKTLCESESGRKIRSEFGEFLQAVAERVTQSNAGAWGGADVALVSRRPQATASTLVRLGTELGVVEAETVGRRGVAAWPPPRR